MCSRGMCTSLAASSLLPVTRLVWPERSGAFPKHPRQGGTNGVAGFFSTAPGSRARNIAGSLGSLIRTHRSDSASTVRSLRAVHRQPTASSATFANCGCTRVVTSGPPPETQARSVSNTRSAERKVLNGLEYLQDAETGRHSSNRHLQSRALH